MVRSRPTSTKGRRRPGDPGGQEPAGGDMEAIQYMKQAVRSGKKWYVALLEAVGMWTLPEESFKGRHYRYLVQDEAFDWLVLAERLCHELDGAVPADEREQLLFRGILPGNISAGDFRELMGSTKHRAHLNFWYGVVVEETLQLAVEEEVRKQHRAKGLPDNEDLIEEAFLRIYEDTRANQLRLFRKEKRIHPRKALSLSEMNEFTYRLFKKRLKIWDPARVASDTRKGLDKLDSLHATNISVSY